MKNNDIQYLLRTIVNPSQPRNGMYCYVRAIDKANESVVVEPVSSDDFDEATGNPENYIYDVKITAFKPITTSGVLLVPEVESYVIISPLELDGWYVSMVSQVSDFLLYNESDSWVKSSGETINITAKDVLVEKGKTITIDADDTITFNGGSNGSFIKISSLVSKMNAIENKVNTILSTLNSTVIPLAPSGTYPLSTNFASVTPITNVVVADIENNKIKH